MYYLLEDNRIIYDEEILNEYKKRGNFNNLKECCKIGEVGYDLQ